jgi:hypothetical protein
LFWSKALTVKLTGVPAVAELGAETVKYGIGVTTKPKALLVRPPTVTITFPVVARGGTGTTMLVALQPEGVPGVPLNTTVLEPWLEPKLVPVIVTTVPNWPEAGDRFEITGATVNGQLLLGTPFTVTTTTPVKALLGTGTTMLVGPQLLGAAGTPLKVTVLAPWVDPKFAPEIVTGAFGAAEAGEIPVMVGPAKT